MNRRTTVLPLEIKPSYLSLFLTVTCIRGKVAKKVKLYVSPYTFKTQPLLIKIWLCNHVMYYAYRQFVNSILYVLILHTFIIIWETTWHNTQTQILVKHYAIYFHVKWQYMLETSTQSWYHVKCARIFEIISVIWLLYSSHCQTVHIMSAMCRKKDFKKYKINCIVIIC